MPPIKDTIPPSGNMSEGEDNFIPKTIIDNPVIRKKAAINLRVLFENMLAISLKRFIFPTVN